MNTKKMKQLPWVLLITAIMFQCNKEDDVLPKTQEPVPVQVNADTLSINGSGEMNDQFSVVGEKSNITSDGFDLDGDLFVETDSGKFRIIEKASFTIKQDDNGRLLSMKGVSHPAMPDFGIFKDIQISKASEAAFEYNTGKFFKDTNADFGSLPLRDTSFYFLFNLINLIPGQNAEMKIKNAQLGVTSFFINLPNEEIIIATGSFKINTPAGEISIGSDLAIGISAQKSFPFTPLQYADTALNSLINSHKAFSDQTGFLYLAGEMSLGDKIPLKLSGNAIIDGDMNVIFSEGFVSGSFTYCMNGELVFGHDLLDLLPIDFETKLTEVTLNIHQKATGPDRTFSMQFAGEFDDNAWMETMVNKISGHNIAQYIPFTGNEGSMFASFGESWEFYVNTFFAFNTPHLGKQPTRRGSLHINEQELKIVGGMAIPFVPAELTATGIFGYDGKIHLESRTKSGIKINDLTFDADLDFDIYNDSATLSGNVDIPYNLGKINVSGTISQQGMNFSGKAGNKEINFGNGIALPVGNLLLEANINSTNPKILLAGNMYIHQLSSDVISVSGSLDKRGLEFSGTLNTSLPVQRFSSDGMSLPFANVKIEARTWAGVSINGNMQFPFGIGNITVEGYINGSKKDLQGFPELFFNSKLNTNPSLAIEGFQFPTSALKIQVSTTDGISFRGNVKLGNHFAFLESSGTIRANKIDFTATAKKNIGFGTASLYSDLVIFAGNNQYPNIASVSGKVHSPFGNISVSGVLGLNGNFKLDGSIGDCSTVSNPFNTFSVQYTKNFTFRQSGVNLGASATLCDNSCEQATKCTSVNASAKVDWSKGTFSVCVPIPVIGDQCF